jgi:hypothetical protein
MALIPTLLADKFEAAWKAKSPAPIIPAQKEANAISQFIDGGQTAFMGVPKSSAGIPLLATLLANTWKSRLPDAQLVGKKEAAGIHQMVMATITSGGKHGVGGFMAGTDSLLADDLARTYKSYLPSEKLVAMKKARNIDTYLKSQVFRGSGVSPEYTPDISSLS